jgi:hypothetical protein
MLIEDDPDDVYVFGRAVEGVLNCDFLLEPAFARHEDRRPTPFQQARASRSCLS